SRNAAPPKPASARSGSRRRLFIAGSAVERSRVDAASVVGRLGGHGDTVGPGAVRRRLEVLVVARARARRLRSHLALEHHADEPVRRRVDPEPAFDGQRHVGLTRHPAAFGSAATAATTATATLHAGEALVEAEVARVAL